MNKTALTRNVHSCPTCLAAFICVGGLMACDDTASAIADETREEIADIERSAEHAEDEMSRQAEETKQELKETGRRIDEHAERTLDRTNAAAQRGKEKLGQVARDVKSGADAVDREVAEEIRDE